MNIDRPAPIALGTEPLMNLRHLILEEIRWHLVRNRKEHPVLITLLITESKVAIPHTSKQDLAATIIALCHRLGCCC